MRIDTLSPGSPALVTFGVHNLSPIPSAETAAVNVADTLTNVPGFTNFLDSNVSIAEVTAYYNNGGADLAVYTEPVGVPGTTSGTGTPPQVALLIRKETGLAGRRNRGRMFVPQPGNNNVGEDGLVNPTPLATYQTAADAFLADLETNLVPMVLLHEDSGIAPTPVSALVVSNVVATQRRRLR